MDLIRQSFVITLVFVLLWLALWWLKSRGLASMGKRLNRPTRRKIELIDRIALTPQHSIQLVRVARRTLVLGVHSSGITLLRELPVRAPGLPVSSPAANVGRLTELSTSAPENWVEARLPCRAGNPACSRLSGGSPLPQRSSRKSRLKN